MAATQILRQDQPDIACGRSHNWTGVVLGKGEPAADADAAKQSAFETAKAAADDLYTTDKNRDCPGNCSPSTASGSAVPQSKAILKFATQNPATGQYTGFAAVFWEVRKSCPGQGQTQAMQLPAPAFAALTEPVDLGTLQPECGKRIVYAGAVIARVYHANVNQASQAAKALAQTEAGNLAQNFSQKTCPNNCPIGNGSGGIQAGIDVTSEKLLQVTNTPGVAYAVAFFEVSLSCPLAAPPPPPPPPLPPPPPGGSDFRRR